MHIVQDLSFVTQRVKRVLLGYAYEPWHIRYVGDIAESIYKEKLTLEEYMNL